MLVNFKSSIALKCLTDGHTGATVRVRMERALSRVKLFISIIEFMIFVAGELINRQFNKGGEDKISAQKGYGYSGKLSEPDSGTVPGAVFKQFFYRCR